MHRHWSSVQTGRNWRGASQYYWLEPCYVTSGHLYLLLHSALPISIGRWQLRSLIWVQKGMNFWNDLDFQGRKNVAFQTIGVVKINSVPKLYFYDLFVTP
jgi:hypothetical protein